jgi:DNA replication protein DnaC
MSTFTLSENTTARRVLAALEASRASQQTYPNWTLDSSPRPRDKVWHWLDSWSSTTRPARKGVVLYGPPGTGKSGLLLGIIRRRAEAEDGLKGFWNIVTSSSVWDSVLANECPAPVAPVFMIHWTDLLDRLAEARRHPEIVDEITYCFEDVEVLGIDDVGVGERGLTGWKEEVLFRILRRVERNQRTILTTNVPPERFPQAFGERAADRLATFVLLHTDGPSLR